MNSQIKYKALTSAGEEINGITQSPLLNLEKMAKFKNLTIQNSFIAKYFLLNNNSTKVRVKEIEPLSKISKIIHQVYFYKEDLPVEIKKNIEKLKRLNPTWEYRLYDDMDIENYIKILNKHKPKIIITYVQSMYQMAKYAREKDLHVEKQNAIHSAAGTLYDFMREEIESVFQCKVFNHYGSREVGVIASECNHHNGLHIIMEHTLVEVVNKDGKPCSPGEKGEIVVTNLNNYSMPLIRYKIGDIGVLQQYSNCDCGCSYPKLEKIVGRTTDVFKTKAGGLVDGHYFINIFYFIEGIKNIQVIQKALDIIIVRIVKGEKSSDSILKTAEKRIKLVMGSDCSVIFEFVNEIPKTKTGKYLYTISELSN